MTNAEIIASALDGLLDHEVSLVVYGRASIALGFDGVPKDVGRSLDMDVILRFSQSAALDMDDQFWGAQAEVNTVLEKQGLYMTHLFQEDQVFLRPDWELHIVRALRPDTRFLKLFRPHTIDLILTKMMRGDDPQDMQDIEFMIRHDGITGEQMEPAFRDVRIPDMQELRDAFERALPVVRKLLAPRSHG
ncbi:hypothetical protein [Prosthecobacter sp.]|uniref:hypothetical protein n=1 Tax=Prosthecobacter sp. TaxID=1965333 RepID=UPI003783795D